MKVIYIIENLVSHKVYIGSALNFAKRKAYHLFQLERQMHSNKHLQNSWNKNGRESFSFWIVECVKLSSDLIEREQYFLDMFQEYSFGVYNVRLVAKSNFGLKYSEETKMKIGRAHKDQKLSNEHKKRFSRKGLKNSDEHKRKSSETQKGKTNKNRILTDDHKRKISESMRRRSEKQMVVS